MTLHIYDGLNVIRRRIDKDAMGRAPRNIVTEMLTTQPGDVHIWTFEGAQHLSKRREIYAPYKDRPSTATDGFFDLVGLIRGALRNTNAIQIDVPGYEADDVMAHLACRYAGKMPIKIHTTDRDLNQLLVLPGVTSTAKPMDGVEPQYTRLYKTFVGDTSDKIPGLKGFGDKGWENANKAKLLQAFGKPTLEGYLKAGMSARLAEKALRDGELLDKFWQVVGFLPITGGVEPYTKPGVPNADVASNILREFGH